MVMDVFWRRLCVCKYDLRRGDLFVLNWAMVRRVRRGSLSSELLVCGGGVRSILLLPLMARCLETIDVCIWRMFDCSDCVGVCGNVCCVAAVVKNSVFLALGPQLDQLSGLSHHIVNYPRQVTHAHHCTVYESFFFYILCTEQSLPVLLSHRHHTATFQSLQSSSHHCFQPSL